MDREVVLLMDAIDGDHASRVRELVENHPSLAQARDANGVSAILHALYQGRREIAGILCEAGPPLNLFEAAAVGDLDRVRTLTQADPNLVHAVSPDGFTPLHLAVFFGQAPVARELVARGAPLDKVSDNAMRVTPLHSAVAGQDQEAITTLVEAGAEVNVRQRHGWTPLHSLAQQGDARMTDLLLARGAQPDARNDDDKTAADLARANGHEELAQRLGAAGSATRQ